jgi:chemotaxis protein methyltransferase CheR
MTQAPSKVPTPLELDLLAQGIFRKHGYDLQGLAQPIFSAKVQDFCEQEGLHGAMHLLDRVLHDDAYMLRLLAGLMGDRRDLFQEPAFFAALRELVVPMLRTHPSAQVWVAACGLGADAISLAILLEEEDLLKRVRIYATDPYHGAIEQAMKACYSADELEAAQTRYADSGGAKRLKGFFQRRQYVHTLKPGLKKRIFFAGHDLAGDGPFQMFHLIICRNVLSSYSSALQARTHALFHESLDRFGYLAMDSGESMLWSPYGKHYEAVSREAGIFQKVMP